MSLIRADVTRTACAGSNTIYSSVMSSAEQDPIFTENHVECLIKNVWLEFFSFQAHHYSNKWFNSIKIPFSMVRLFLIIK